MLALGSMADQGECAELVPSFPCVTWPVQANMLTGRLPSQHGVVANGFYWRDAHEVEMWTAWNDKIEAPQIWDLLHAHDQELTSAVWFPMLSKGCGADYICMPAPVHNPDGSESLWCYTKPTEYYGTLLDRLGHFPLQHFWGPAANIKSTAWIVNSAICAAQDFRPQFFYIYLPHLDYAAQRDGPDSPAAQAALAELEQVVSRLHAALTDVYTDSDPLWLVASEYTVVPVSHVCYPNRMLRDSGLLLVQEQDGQEHLDLKDSSAWAMVDHQFSHVFVKDRDTSVVERVAQLFTDADGIAEVLSGQERAKYGMNHARSGDVLLISNPESWQAYYWWLDDCRAPEFARTVDIHRKPGYDPVELCWDPKSRSVPLDATRIAGSHGAPAVTAAQRGVLIASRQGVLDGSVVADTDVAGIVLRHFGAAEPSGG